MATETTLQAKIDAIDDAIDALVANPDSLMDYKIGTRQFNKKSKVGALRSLRDIYREQLEALPSEVITVFDEPGC